MEAGGGQAAVRLIEHILINSISPPCNRPHGYLLARAPEKHAMGAIPRETETPAYLGDARARADARERDEQRDGRCVRACTCLSVRVCRCTHVQERGDRAGVRGARGPGRFTNGGGVGSPATSSFRFTRANHRPTNWSVLRDRFRAPSIPSRPPSKSHAFSRECSAINGVTARARFSARGCQV